MAEKNIPKTAITPPFGLFKFLVMTFRLRNAAQTFQSFIDEVLCGLDFTYACTDDTFGAASLMDEHLCHLGSLLSRLRDYGVSVNAERCIFGNSEVKFSCQQTGHNLCPKM